MKRFYVLAPMMGATKCFAINIDRCSFQRNICSAHPAQKALVEGFGIQHSENIPKDIMRGNAVCQRQTKCRSIPFFTFLRRFGNLGVALSATNGFAESNHQYFDERIFHLHRLVSVVQRGKGLLEREYRHEKERK